MSLLQLYTKVNELSTEEAFRLLVAHGQADASQDPAEAVDAFVQMYVDEGGI